MSIRSTTLLFLALLSAPTLAGETPYGSQRPTLMYWWCQGGSTSYATNPAEVTYYSSNVFANDSAKTHMGQQELNAAFWKFVVAKYGVPASSGAASCQSGGSEGNTNTYKADQLRILSMNKTSKVVETDWAGG